MCVFKGGTGTEKKRKKKTINSKHTIRRREWPLWRASWHTRAACYIAHSVARARQRQNQTVTFLLRTGLFAIWRKKGTNSCSWAQLGCVSVSATVLLALNMCFVAGHLGASPFVMSLKTLPGSCSALPECFCLLSNKSSHWIIFNDLDFTKRSSSGYDCGNETVQACQYINIYMQVSSIIEAVTYKCFTFLINKY